MSRSARTGMLGMFVCVAIGFTLASRAGLAPDTDGDGIPDVLDKCVLDSRNVVASCDTDQDGYGNPCDGDFDQNTAVNSGDFSTFFMPAFKANSNPKGQDMDCNGATNGVDFNNYFMPKFRGLLGGAVPGPSGLACAGMKLCN